MCKGSSEISWPLCPPSPYQQGLLELFSNNSTVAFLKQCFSIANPKSVHPKISPWLWEEDGDCLGGSHASPLPHPFLLIPPLPLFGIPLLPWGWGPRVVISD